MSSFTRKFSRWGLGIAAAALALAGAQWIGLASANSTISTNIQTDGTLSVTGASTLTGLTAMGYASSTAQSLTSNLMVNGFATTTGSNGNIATQGTLLATGLSTLTGGFISQASSTVVGAFIDAGTASTSKLYVGADQNSTINGIINGSCTIAATSLTASSTTYVNCTGATGVTNSYSVVVTPASLPAPVVIQSASTTSTGGTIQIGLLDTGLSTTTAGGILSTTVNFWAFR